MNLLIVFTSIEGQTQKIAEFIKETLHPSHQVTVVNVTDVDFTDSHSTHHLPKPDDFDAILVGSSLHKGEYHSAIVTYIKQNLEALNRKPSAFLSVSLAIESSLIDERKEVDLLSAKFLDTLQWQPKQVVQIAGALRYSEYDYFKRLIMKMIAKKNGGGTDTSQDYEYTDWEMVKQFAIDFVNEYAV